MRLRQGVTAALAISTLRGLAVAAENVRAWSGPPEHGRDAYLTWTETAERQLRALFVEPDLAGALQSDRYWHIRAMAATPGRVVRPHPLIDAEIDVQAALLNATSTQLETFRDSASRPGTTLVLDTNVFLHCTLFPAVDWCSEFATMQARLVVPLLVLDELDDKTFSGNKRISKRAEKVLRAFDRYMDALVRDGFAAVADHTTIEILADEDHHLRRTNSDTELLDRAAFLHQVIEKPIILVTADRGMRIRALTRGLTVAAMPDHLRLPPDNDPTTLPVQIP